MARLCDFQLWRLVAAFLGVPDTQTRLRSLNTEFRKKITRCAVTNITCSMLDLDWFLEFVDVAQVRTLDMHSDQSWSSSMDSIALFNMHEYDSDSETKEDQEVRMQERIISSTTFRQPKFPTYHSYPFQAHEPRDSSPVAPWQGIARLSRLEVLRLDTVEGRVGYLGFDNFLNGLNWTILKELVLDMDQGGGFTVEGRMLPSMPSLETLAISGFMLSKSAWAELSAAVPAVQSLSLLIHAFSTLFEVVPLANFRSLKELVFQELTLWPCHSVAFETTFPCLVCVKLRMGLMSRAQLHAMFSCTSLEILSLESVRFQGFNSDTLELHLGAPRLRELELKYPKMGAEPYADSSTVLLTNLADLPALTHLNCQGFSLVLQQRFPPSLLVVSLRSCHFESEVLASLVRSAPFVLELDLYGTKTQPAQLVLLRDCPALEFVDLSCCSALRSRHVRELRACMRATIRFERPNTNWSK